MLWVTSSCYIIIPSPFLTPWDVIFDLYIPTLGAGFDGNTYYWENLHFAKKQYQIMNALLIVCGLSLLLALASIE